MRGRAEYTAAYRLFERALAPREKTLGTDHPDVAIDYNYLGTLLKDLGDLPNARIYFERVITIDEKVYGIDHPNIAIDYNNLGMLLQVMGDLPNARIYYDKALKILIGKLGENHPYTQQSQEWLAGLT